MLMMEIAGSLGKIRVEMFDMQPGIGHPAIGLQNTSLSDTLNMSTVE